MTCPCGTTAAYRLEMHGPSTRGVAYWFERLCPRCADRKAREMLADGSPAIEGVRIP